MSENDTSIDTFKRWTVPVLQQYLRIRGLRTSGKKEELVALVYSADLMKIKPVLTPAEERKLKADQNFGKGVKNATKRKEDYIECSDVDSQDEGFGSATNLEPSIPPTSISTSTTSRHCFKSSRNQCFISSKVIYNRDAFFFYKSWYITVNIESLQEKINLLKNVSDENFSSLFGGTQTYSETVKTMAIMVDRIKNANNEIDDISMSVGSIKMDVKFHQHIKKELEILDTNISTVNGDLSTEKNKLDNFNLLLKTVQEKQGEIKTMDAKLDEAQQSVSHLEEDLIKHDKEIKKYQKNFLPSQKYPTEYKP
ncbi:unnamed protein product [Mytilus edulis]|uniref:SAP domain-containing protein n=1 Tax=Mytilus edulis TaxID=6550 RepID=A0A8S3RR48_MYTED|nr:unnamed protein product [Mytilus edulis]